MLLGSTDQEKWEGLAMLHSCDSRKIHIKLSSEKLKRRDHLGDLGADGRILLKQNRRQWGGKVWTKLI
jgi:hypothetical protein